jgi:hypothetical protein
MTTGAKVIMTPGIRRRNGSALCLLPFLILHNTIASSGTKKTASSTAVVYFLCH